MQAMAACAAVPAKMRKKLERAWSAARNWNPLPFSCQVGLELMKQRLAAIGC
jgi:hypothetical protein